MTVYTNGRASTAKIDNLATVGLLGVSNSLTYRVHEIEKHFHSRERWFGISANQTGNDWALSNTLNPYTTISGAGVFGGDANDEAKIFGTDDTPVIGGMIKYDVHRILILALSVDTPYIFRLVYGSDTTANNIGFGYYSEFMAQNTVTGSKAGGFPLEVMMPRATCGTDKVWI